MNDDHPDPTAAAESGASRRGRSKRKARSRGPIDAHAQGRIGRNLRLLYADVLTQPLPDRLTALLADLATKRETP